MTDLETLKERIVGRYDPDYLVDVLGITSQELLDAFEDKLSEKREEFSELDDNNDED